MKQPVGRIVSDLAVTAQWRYAIGNPVSSLEIENVLADILNNAHAFKANDNWTRGYFPGVGNACTMIGIGKINPDGRVSQSHFMMLNTRNWPLLPSHGFRST